MKSRLIEYPIRLQAYLAKCGLGSRRACEKIILDGRVTVDGRPVTQLGSRVEQGESVSCDGKPVVPESPAYIMLNKPAGYLTSNADPHHTDFAIDLIDSPQKDSLFHVGRLDLDTSGLILFTNDGEFAQMITHPSFEIQKEYLVEVDRPLELGKVKKALVGGVTVEGITYRFKRVEPISPVCVKIILTEGKNREIRRVFTHLGYRIKALHRTRIDGIVLGDLPVGSFRSLTEDEIQSILGASHR